jgi:hypothetical protein
VDLPARDRFSKGPHHNPEAPSEFPAHRSPGVALTAQHRDRGWSPNRSSRMLAHRIGDIAFRKLRVRPLGLTIASRGGRLGFGPFASSEDVGENGEDGCTRRIVCRPEKG